MMFALVSRTCTWASVPIKPQGAPCPRRRHGPQQRAPTSAKQSSSCRMRTASRCEEIEKNNDSFLFFSLFLIAWLSYSAQYVSVCVCVCNFLWLFVFCVVVVCKEPRFCQSGCGAVGQRGGELWWAGWCWGETFNVSLKLSFYFF